MPDWKADFDASFANTTWHMTVSGDHMIVLVVHKCAKDEDN
jgi:hypothetical protein